MDSKPQPSTGAHSLANLLKSKGMVVALGFIISILLLVMTARKIAWHEVKDAFSHGVWMPWLPMAVCVYIVGMLLRGLRLKQLVSMEAQITVTTASNIVCVGYATNNVLPARLGEFARAGMLAERTGLPYALALTVTFLERLLDGLVILCIFVVASCIVPTQEWMRQAAQLASVIFATAVAFILLLAFAPQLSLMVASRLTAPLGRKWHDRAIALITQITRGLSCLHDLNTTLAVLFTSLSVWMAEGLMYALIMPCFAIPFSPIKAQAVMALTNLGILVPSSPGFVGVFHYICSQALQAVTGQNGLPALFAIGFTVPTLPFINKDFLIGGTKVVPEVTALSYATVVHLVFYITVTVWGVIAMVRYGVELGATAALAWQAKPLATLGDEDKMAVITSVAASNSERRQTFTKAPFWLALCEAILPVEALGLSIEDRRTCVDFAAAFVCQELSQLPQSLRPLVKIGITGFRAYVAFTHLRPFEALSLKDRTAVVGAWSYGPVSLTRRFFKPIRSVALLAFYECPPVLAAISTGAGTAGEAPVVVPTNTSSANHD